MNPENPVRVLQVFISMNRGGAESLFMNIYKNIDRAKLQFDFLVHTTETGIFDNEIVELGGRLYNVINPAEKRYYTVNSLVKYRKQLFHFLKNTNEYKIVHVHLSGRSSDVLSVAKKCGIPVRIAHSHITIKTRNFKNIAYKILGFPVKYLATDKFACSLEAGLFLFGKRNSRVNAVTVINNAIDSERFIFDKDKRNRMRKELNIEDKYVVGNIARFDHQKNHVFLVDIFKAIHERNDNSILMLVGDGDLKPLIEKKIDKLGLKKNVIFTGVRSDIPDLLQAMDVFVFPSLYEGFGIVAVEAQAAGLPTIVSEAIPIEAFITDLIEKESLKAPAVKWAERVLKYVDGYKRIDTSKIIREKGYDIADTAKWLESFYLKRA